ncbi:hypothetical protein G3A_17330 [Bacillus sp. 17376]|nr:hypothetical protein G3A_17330 [Bacillus sp. 17376]
MVNNDSYGNPPASAGGFFACEAHMYMMLFSSEWKTVAIK